MVPSSRTKDRTQNHNSQDHNRERREREGGGGGGIKYKCTFVNRIVNKSVFSCAESYKAEREREHE